MREKKKLRAKMKNELQSQVQGHLHQQGYIEFSEGKHQKIFGKLSIHNL